MTETAKARYAILKSRRQPFLDRARECARLTIPSLIPPEGHTPSSPLPEPYQGLGSRLVVNLASRLMTALLPPGRGFFTLGVRPEVLLQAGQSSVPVEVEQAMALTEVIIHAEVERRAWRQPTNLSLQHLIVGGNAMEQMLPDNTIRVFRLDQYVVVRDPSGQLIEFIVCEDLVPASLSGNLKAIYDAENQGNDHGVTQPVQLYTHGRLSDGEWEVHQEFFDKIVPGTSGFYNAAALPFMPLRWSVVAGEDYGRSKVDEHLPDLRTLDGLTKAIIDGAAMASRNITLIRPNAAGGLNLRRRIAKANNGEYVIGNPEDVVMLQFTNVGGLQLVSEEIIALRQELGAAFLLTQAVTRDAERVTATEIRQLAQELEGVLGGVYSMLSQEMMSRRIGRLIYQMQANASLPEWPPNTIEPTILTGLEALGREAQVSNVVTALQMLQGFDQSVLDYIKWEVLLKKGFMGLNLADAVLTEAEAMELRQARMEQQMMQDAVAGAAGPVAGAVAQQATAPAQ